MWENEIVLKINLNLQNTKINLKMIFKQKRKKKKKRKKPPMDAEKLITH